MYWSEKLEKPLERQEALGIQFERKQQFRADTGCKQGCEAQIITGGEFDLNSVLSTTLP